MLRATVIETLFFPFSRSLSLSLSHCGPYYGMYPVIICSWRASGCLSKAFISHTEMSFHSCLATLNLSLEL